MMDILTNFRAFLAVSRNGSFTGAARELQLAPSVITKRILQIEALLDAPLFERSTRQVRLTPAGQRCLPSVQRLVADADNVFNIVQGPAQSLQGSIRVKAPSAVAALLIGPILDRFLQAFPLVQLDVMAIDRVVNPIDEGFDVVLTLLPQIFGGVISIPLCAMPRVLCASPDYLARKGVPSDPVELAQHDTLSFLPTGNTWEFAGLRGPVRVDVHPRLTTNDAQLLLSAAQAGNGISILGEYLARPSLERGDLVQVLPKFSIPELWLKALVPESRIAVDRVQALLTWVQTHLPGPQSAKSE